MPPEQTTTARPSPPATSAAQVPGAGRPTRPAAKPSLPVRMLKAFAMFWWDFLVGDTPEFFVGVLVLVGVVLALVKAASLNSVAIGLFPALVVVLLAGSVLQARRSKH